MWREENPETPVATAFLASPDPEVTRVCLVRPAVRVCLDFPVTPSKVKDSRDNAVTRDNRETPVSPGRRENMESWDSPARQDLGVTTVRPVSPATLENLVVPVEKVHPEKATGTPEVQELKASPEGQASQVAAAMTAPPATTAFPEFQVSLK